MERAKGWVESKNGLDPSLWTPRPGPARDTLLYLEWRGSAGVRWKQAYAVQSWVSWGVLGVALCSLAGTCLVLDGLSLGGQAQPLMWQGLDHPKRDL